jgi:hypothetical protein
MQTRSVWILACVSLIACSGASASGTPEAGSDSPSDAAAASDSSSTSDAAMDAAPVGPGSGTFVGTIHSDTLTVNEVVGTLSEIDGHSIDVSLTDSTGSCSRMQSRLYRPGETILHLMPWQRDSHGAKTDATPGDYVINGATSETRVALAQFNQFDNLCNNSAHSRPEDTASTGTIHITTVETVPGGHVIGTYDLMFGTDHVTGTFDAPFCAGADLVWIHGSCQR